MMVPSDFLIPYLNADSYESKNLRLFFHDKKHRGELNFRPRIETTVSREEGSSLPPPITKKSSHSLSSSCVPGTILTLYIS